MGGRIHGDEFPEAEPEIPVLREAPFRNQPGHAHHIRTVQETVRGTVPIDPLVAGGIAPDRLNVRGELERLDRKERTLDSRADAHIAVIVETMEQIPVGRDDRVPEMLHGVNRERRARVYRITAKPVPKQAAVGVEAKAVGETQGVPVARRAFIAVECATMHMVGLPVQDTAEPSVGGEVAEVAEVCGEPGHLLRNRLGVAQGAGGGEVGALEIGARADRYRERKREQLMNRQKRQRLKQQLKFC